jgi:hypothetical protein
MNLNSLIADYFENKCEFDISMTTVVRADGIVVYSSKDLRPKAASIGALVGGVWQAAEALNTHSGVEEKVTDYRFSFDKADSGIYILPVLIEGSSYYMATLYSDTFNPALLKRNFRLLKEDIETFLSINKVTKTHLRKEFLFKNITDEEMDNLFAFGR